MSRSIEQAKENALLPRQGWRDAAACKGLGDNLRSEHDDLFIPPDGAGDNTFQYGPARVVCGGCPVRLDCLLAAMWNPAWGDYGMFGATAPVERKVFRATIRELAGLAFPDPDQPTNRWVMVAAMAALGEIRDEVRWPTLSRGPVLAPPAHGERLRRSPGHRVPGRRPVASAAFPGVTFIDGPGRVSASA